MKKYIDLHVHSNASDGKFSPEEVINIALTNQLQVISLTEHYNLGSYRRAKLASQNMIEVIPGIEIGASLTNLNYSKKHICHILAYYPSYKICKILNEYEISRSICVKKTLEKLKKHIPITYSQVKKYARDKNSIGRFDIATALAKLGYATDPISAYGEFLDTGKTFYVEREKMSTEILIKNIRNVHGVPVLAHPKSLKMSYTDFENFISILKSYGLEGIEVYNSHNTDEQVEFFSEIADEFNMLKTVGSDFHGKGSDNIVIGRGINDNLLFSDYCLITDLKKRQNAILNSKK